jgi:beta-phosphoglucomutase-like phosphatase (HAD superfamily)
MTPAECLVLEDSLAGIRSARAAGMRVLALATTYPLDKLYEANCVLPSLEHITPDAAIGRLV